VAPTLTDRERAMLVGDDGPGVGEAMSLVVRLATVSGADDLVEVSSAHIDSCLYHGQAGLDFALHLAERGARVRVPTTLNVGALDLIHPDLFRGDERTRLDGRRLMETYVQMGCRATFTCAPYQLPERPSVGQDVAWAESNAIVFANSVLGARTERYGDFIDICAAITGRVPRVGLHLPKNRHATVVFDVGGVPRDRFEGELAYALIGHVVGHDTGVEIPAIVGLPSETTEDQLKALAAASASYGGVAMFHAVGVTPEAPTLDAALGGRPPARTVEVTAATLAAARAALGPVPEGAAIDAVSIGTPHLSPDGFAELARLVRELEPSFRVPVYASTHRAVLEEASARGWLEPVEGAGVIIVVDTCTYITPILHPDIRVAMTDSAKWAYYAPGNIGVDVAFGSLEECLRSAAAGYVVRSGGPWDAA
jgi:predicted aconitase